VTAPPSPPAGGLSQPEALDFYKALRDASDAALTRAHLIWALVLAAVLALTVFAGFRAYAWHVNETAKLEADVQRNQLAYDSAAASAERWAKRSERLEDSVRVDTELVTHVIETAPKPVLVPITAPSGVTSIVPMIPAVTFDSTAAACTRLEHDCTKALAAKDSALAQRDKALAHGDSLTALALKKASDAERANFFSKILYGAGGAILGRATCSVH